MRKQPRNLTKPNKAFGFLFFNTITGLLKKQYCITSHRYLGEDVQQSNNPEHTRTEVIPKNRLFCALLGNKQARSPGVTTAPAQGAPAGQREGGTHLEHCQECLGEVVEGAPLGLRLVKVKLATEQLHPKQGEDDDEEEKQKQQ